MYLRACLVVATLAVVVTAAPLPKMKPKNPLEEIAGLWEVVTVERPGGVLVKMPPRTLIHIEEGKWSFLREDETGKATSSLDYAMTLSTGSTPFALDLKRSGDGTQHLKGLLQLDGGRLRTVYSIAPDRPKELKAVNPRDVLLTLRRVASP